jgi:4-amino-4-deoxy-L-arabinose transferase-like glycosyltransferase
MALLRFASVPVKTNPPDISADTIPIHPPAGKHLVRPEPRPRISLLWFFAILLLCSFALRIFYVGHLYEDDGMWITAAQQILRGKALYKDIYFDKPPLLPLAYAGLFRLFGPQVLVIRVFTVFYATTISGLLFVFGSRLYNRRAGLIAAALFTFFSTTAPAGHVQGLNTDFFAALWYTAAALAFFLAVGSWSTPHVRIHKPALYSVLGGILTGIACQTNPKGIFDLVFFGLLVVASIIYRRARHRALQAERSLPADLTNRRLAPTGGLLMGAALVGTLAGSLPAIAYVWRSNSLAAYWNYVWAWGVRYSLFYPVVRSVRHGLWVTGGYFGVNSTLAIALLFVAARCLRDGLHAWRVNQRARSGAPVSMFGTYWRLGSAFEADVTLLLWFSVSFLGLSVGGRFFPHYFFQMLPALCLIGARGLLGIYRTLAEAYSDAAKRNMVRLAASVLIIGFAVTLVRFHTRTLVLASDWLKGKKSEATRAWYHEQRNRNEQMAAAMVSGDPPQAWAGDLRFALTPIESHQPGAASSEAASNTLFVWGYRPSLYYWSGLVPASKYLSTQPLTGVPADAQYEAGERRSVLSAEQTARARAELVEELNRAAPRYIIDELRMYNSALAMTSYPDLRRVMRQYEQVGAAGDLMIYRRKALEETASKLPASGHGAQ